MHAYKQVSLVLLSFFAGSGLVATAQRHTRMKERLYAQEEALAQREQNDETARQKKLLRRAQRRIARKERNAAIADYREWLANKQKPQDVPGQYAHVFPVPSWPRSLQYGYRMHEGQLAYTSSRASKALNGQRSLVNVAALDVGEKPAFQEMLLVSKGASELGATVGQGNEYASDLARTPVTITARDVSQQLDLSYTFAMRNNSVMFGFTLPVVEKTRYLSFRPEVSDAVRANLRKRTPLNANGAPITVYTKYRNENFRANYGTSVKALFKDMLEEKGMLYESEMHQLSLGDPTFFVTGAIFSQFFERCHVSAQITLPYADKEDLSLFFAPRLGNGGFVTGALEAGLLGKKQGGWHPHAMISLSGGLPATVKRRVPMMVAALGSTDNVVMGDLVSNKTLTPSQSDTTIPAFAQKTAELVQRPGVQALVRFGALFPECFVREGQLDVTYQARLKTAGATYAADGNDAYDVTWWDNQSYDSEHRIAADFSYQPNDYVQCMVGLFGTFAGKNVPLSYGYRLALTGRW